MPYVTVPKDLSAVKPKIFLGLTKRQIICFGSGMLAGIPLFFLLKPYIGTSIASLIMIAVMMPFFMFALVQKNGEPLEALIGHFIRSRFLRPKQRPYETNNYYDALERQGKLRKEVKQITHGKRKLTRADKKLIREKIEQARGDGKRISAQQTIPYLRMYPDGVCRVTHSYYSKTLQFEDANYQLAHNEDKETFFAGWSDFINYFDSSLSIQFLFPTLPVGKEDAEQNLTFPVREDLDPQLQEEFSDFIRSQAAKGDRGLKRPKYLTFGIEADSVRAAKQRLDRIETELILGFKRLGVKAFALNGKERLELMHSMLHMDTLEPFRFEWDWLVRSGLTTQDFIAPSSFDFSDGRSFRIGDQYCSASVLQILASELNDRSLTGFLDMESSQLLSMHVKAVDQTDAIRQIKHTITELDRTKIEEQKRAVKSGYDMDILPSDLATYGNDAKELLQNLQSRNERMFLVTFLVVNTGSTKRQLKNNVMQARSIAQAMNCTLMRLDFQQENALVSCLPLGVNRINIRRGLTTSSAAIFIPFTTQELFQHGLEALFYGNNALSNNIIMVDRKKTSNPNGLILGTPGSGKSFMAKLEMYCVYILTKDHMLICDPESEYAPLVASLNGQIVRISPTSADFINPLDLNLDYSDEENPLSLKSDFVLSLCELIVGGKDGLKPKEKTIIDRCVRLVYKDYLADPRPENMPILEDLYNVLRAQEEREAQDVATALEIYVSGSLNVFNHRTNVDIHNRVVCYDIKDLGKQLKTLGMLIVQDQVWNRVTSNRAKKQSTRFYIDEMHLLLKEEQTAAYTVEIWKRFRKWGGIPTGITQNVKDLLSSREIENIFENSDFIIMLNQAAGDREILAKQLGISEHQLSYIKQSAPGEGLLFYGNTILPFVNRFPKDTRLYHILTTKLDEAPAVPMYAAKALPSAASESVKSDDLSNHKNKEESA